MKTLKSIAILALTSLVLSTGAKAVLTPGITEAEVFLAFAAPATPGTQRPGNVYMFDLGNASQFTTTSSLTISGITVTDITSGSKGNINLSTGVWAAFGADPQNNTSDIWVSRATGSPSILNGSVAIANSDILTAIFLPPNPVATSSGNSVIMSAAQTSGYADYNFGASTGPSPTLAWEYFNFSLEGAISAGLDLYRVIEGGTGNATKLGTLSFNQTNGDVTFNGALVPVPEPATFAAGLGVVGVCCMSILRRRRKAQPAA